jgi:N6-adenosine-specific RNA methylase IME4
MGEIAGHLMQFVDPSCCTVACWQTWPMESQQDALLIGLGFRKIGLLFLWWKLTESGKDAFGGGLAGTRANSEPCFLWRMGRPLKRASASERQDIEDVQRAHSQKPPEARRRLERMFPIEDRIELYARERVAGWAQWGSEVPDAAE